MPRIGRVESRQPRLPSRRKTKHNPVQRATPFSDAADAALGMTANPPKRDYRRGAKGVVSAHKKTPWQPLGLRRALTSAMTYFPAEAVSSAR